MTAIKQVAVTTPRHVKNLGGYLNDERALARSSQHIMKEADWEKEMDRTRETYGHNVASRAGAANTYMYHQIIGFLPEEADFNGGKMTPECCMQFAKEWVESRYPNQEAVWVLHREHCARDGTDRYAVHIGINRTDLETGRRLNEGRAKQAKIERANAMRDMDRRWGLHQMKANERNSEIHARQPSRAEREMAARGIQPQKAFIRQHVARRVRDIAAEAPKGNRMRELSKRLEADGITMSKSKNGKQLQFEHDGFRVNGNKLGRGFSMSGVAKGLGITAGIMMVRAMEDDRER